MSYVVTTVTGRRRLSYHTLAKAWTSRVVALVYDTADWLLHRHNGAMAGNAPRDRRITEQSALHVFAHGDPVGDQVTSSQRLLSAQSYKDQVVSLQEGGQGWTTMPDA